MVYNLETCKSSIAPSKAFNRLPHLKSHSPSVNLIAKESRGGTRHKKSFIATVNSRCAAPSESRVKTTLPHRVSTAHPRQETLEAKTVAAMGRCSVPVYIVSMFGEAGHSQKPKELTSSDPYTSNKASDQFLLSRRQLSAPRNHLCAYCHRQFLQRPASSNPRSQSLSSLQDLSSCRRL